MLAESETNSDMFVTASLRPVPLGGCSPAPWGGVGSARRAVCAQNPERLTVSGAPPFRAWALNNQTSSQGTFFFSFVLWKFKKIVSYFWSQRFARSTKCRPETPSSLLGGGEAVLGDTLLPARATADHYRKHILGPLLG